MDLLIRKNDWPSAFTACYAMVWLIVSHQTAAAFVEVYGGPTLVAGAGESVNSRAVAVNEGGVAIGSIALFYHDFDISVLVEQRAFRWDGAGTAPLELQPLGVDSGGRSISDVRAINNAGTAVGSSQYFDAMGISLGDRPVRWDGVSAVELATLNPSAPGAANDINAAGTIVGQSNKFDSNGASQGLRAVQWPNSSTTAIELEASLVPVSGVLAWRAVAINDAGVVAGTSVNGAIRWDSPTTPVLLDSFGTLPSGSGTTSSTAINNQGTIVGRALQFENGALLGNSSARWDGSGTAAQPLESLSPFIANGGPDVADINDSGVAVGYAIKYDQLEFLGARPVRWDALSSTAIELEVLGTDPDGETAGGANAINNLGYVVGSVQAYDVSGMNLGRRAAMWSPDGSVIDLNSLIEPASGWLLTSAQDISDSGWIVGDGQFDPDGAGALAPYPRAFLLHYAAIPEPSAIVLWASAMATLFAARGGSRR